MNILIGCEGKVEDVRRNRRRHGGPAGGDWMSNTTLNAIKPKAAPRARRTADAKWADTESGMDYIVDGVVRGSVYQDDHGWSWSCPRFNSRGRCERLERAKSWVIHYVERA